MAESLNLQTADEFRDITDVDISAYFATFAIFIDIGYTKVVDYYSGTVNVPDRTSFQLLEFLADRTKIISQKVNVYKESLNNYKFWILIEKFEEVKQKVDTIVKISKYLRSSILPNTYKKDPLIDYTLKQGETLESVSRNVLSDPDFLNDWSDIALQNNLIEEDYTPAGGNNLKISYSNLSSIVVNSVIDNLSLDNIYGKDIAKVISFITDSEGDDISVLTPKQTILQTVEILATLKKGNNPAFPEDGLDKSYAIGRNIASIAFPAIFRQFQQTFQKDDTISSISITDLSQVRDEVEIEFQITTILQELLPKFSVKV